MGQNSKSHTNVGRRVKYSPASLRDMGDVETEGVIENYEPAGYIFRMDMLVMKGVDHWIPAHECEFLN